MNQPMQLSGHLRLINRHPLSTLLTLGAVLTFPLLLSSCAQFNQLMGRPAESTDTAQPTPAQEPGPQATVTAPAAAGPASSQHTPAAIAQPRGPDSKQAHDKAVAEKDQPKKDKKASVASDKKSAKKPSKPEAQQHSEDVFLPPIPLPSKPAAIGGSGG